MKSHDSMVSYLHDKYRTSTVLIKPVPRFKHPHHIRKEQQTFMLMNDENRLVPIHPEHDRQRIHLELMRRELTQALGHVRYIAEHCAHDAFIESVRNEWKYIAVVIDRLQFVTFFAVTIIGSLALLFQVRFDRRGIFLSSQQDFLHFRFHICFKCIQMLRKNSFDLPIQILLSMN